MIHVQPLIMRASKYVEKHLDKCFIDSLVT